MATLEQIQARLKKLQAQAEAIVAKQSSSMLETIRGLMAKHGLTTADIDAYVGSKKRRPKTGVKAAVKTAMSTAKYRDPKTGAAWSGHGRAPKWIATAKNRDKFLVDGRAASASVASASKKKAAGNYARGPQPAMYRDPKSGATWSGRGRAPAWIAEAKDRNKFLISGAAEATVEATASASGVASKTKTVGKNALKSVGATAGKGQPKGAQAAKYLEPKTGATWSGRGRAPAWLAGAKDRSKFLIDGAGVASDVSASTETKPSAKKAVAKNAVVKKVAATKTAPAKKVAVKKVIAKKAVSAKVPAKKAPAKNAPRQSVAVLAPADTVEPSTELTT